MLEDIPDADFPSLSSVGKPTSKSEEDGIAVNFIDEFKRKGMPWIDISGRKLISLPSSLNNFNTVQHLNINSNCLTTLPETFFESFPLLSWLDVRFNEINVIPTAGLSSHNRLQTFLIQGNKLTTLPLELGLVKPLRDIQFANNSLEFPPAEVLSQGTAAIKDFLAAVLSTNGKIPNFMHDDPSEVTETATLDERRKQVYDTSSKASRANDDAMSTQQRKKFSSSVVTIEEQIKRKSKSNEAFGKMHQAGIVSTELPSTDLLHIRAKEQSSRDARQKKLLKIDKVLQRRKDSKSLDEWRDEAKELQYRKDLEKRYNGGKLNYQEPAKLAPFGVNEADLLMKSDAERRKPSPPQQRPRGLSPETIEKMEKLQAEKDVELTVLIKDHMSRVVNRARVKPKERPNSNNPTAQDELNMAKRELEIAQRLQHEVSRRRREMEFRMNLLQQKIAAKVTEQTIVAKHQAIPWSGA